MSPHLCGDIKIAPCSNIRTRGYPAVFGSITLEPPSVFLPCTGTWRHTRTPTAVKGNAHSRFHTTACRLRNYRTLSASGRFSTSDSPPRLPLNLYCKSAAPCGVATLPLCIFSIAAASHFVNVLINKNTEQCSVKTPNFHRAPVPTPRVRGALATGCAPARSRKNRRAHPSAHSGSCLVSAVARRGALPAEDPVIQILIHGASPPV